MEQTTQYLYEYENGERVRNIGCMKIEKQMNRCVVQIYANHVDDIHGVLFQKENGETYLGCWEAQQLPVQEEQEQEMPVQTQEETIEELDEYIHPKQIVYEKMTRQEISRFPRSEWRVANNSFLMHGYRNYHHLLYIEEEGNVWLGVPGIFHEKEQVAAQAFGFPEFRRLTDAELKLEENERNTYEDFGYWCRQIPIS